MKNKLLIVFILIISLNALSSTNGTLKNRISIAGNGLYIRKSFDFVDDDPQPYHASDYMNLIFEYKFSERLKISHRLYIEEFSHCVFYGDMRNTVGFLKISYELPLILGWTLAMTGPDIGRVTTGNGLIFREFEAAAYHLSLSRNNIEFYNTYMGIGYVYDSDSLVYGFSMGRSFGAYLVYTPFYTYPSNIREKEYMPAIHFKIPFLSRFSIEGELAGSYNSINSNFGGAGSLGLDFTYEKDTTILSLGAGFRRYDVNFKAVSLDYHAIYNKLDARYKSLNNPYNYLAFPGNVNGMHLYGMLTFRIFRDIYMNLMSEFLQLDFEYFTERIFLMEAGVEYRPAKGVRAFAGLSNKNINNGYSDPLQRYNFRRLNNPFFIAYVTWNFKWDG